MTTPVGQRRDARPADHVQRDGASRRRGGLAGGNREHHRPRPGGPDAHAVADDVDELPICVQRRHLHPDATSPAAARLFREAPVSAEFIPSRRFLEEHRRKAFTVTKPAYTTLAGGVKIATIAPGSGPAIQSGQTANVLYTGYLAKNGQIFDDSINDGGAPLSFTLGSGQVIPGFDAGTVGMQVGETRIIQIPPAEGYGAMANGPIPANSTLIFVVTLESIS